MARALFPYLSPDPGFRSATVWDCGAAVVNTDVRTPYPCGTCTARDTECAQGTASAEVLHAMVRGGTCSGPSNTLVQKAATDILSKWGDMMPGPKNARKRCMAPAPPALGVLRPVRANEDRGSG